MAYTEVGSANELRDLLGAPHERVVAKERVRLHSKDRDWLEASPFCVVATCDADGNCDASPKGDPAGHLVHVVDEVTICIPERPGNRRADGFLNVLANPHVGIISLIPGRNETLRINGRARVLRDAPFFDEMVVRGHRPILALLVEIEQIFFHCSRAFMRSGFGSRSPGSRMRCRRRPPSSRRSTIPRNRSPSWKPTSPRRTTPRCCMAKLSRPVDLARGAVHGKRRVRRPACQYSRQVFVVGCVDSPRLPGL